MKTLLACATLLLALFTAAVQANTEKVIFLAPPTTKISSVVLSGVARLDTLTPDHPSIRRSLAVAFPSTPKSHAREYWFLLRNLTSSQRHEVRVCWAAIQPTEFWLDVFTFADIIQDPNLSENLAASASQISSEPDIETSDSTPTNTIESLLGLRVRLAADFFTSNKTLMLHPPPVNVDIILDPYVANIFPKSLLPTAVYICILAVLGWYASGIAWSIIKPPVEKAHAD